HGSVFTNCYFFVFILMSPPNVCLRTFPWIGCCPVTVLRNSSCYLSFLFSFAHIAGHHLCADALTMLNRWHGIAVDRDKQVAMIFICNFSPAMKWSDIISGSCFYNLHIGQCFMQLRDELLCYG